MSAAGNSDPNPELRALAECLLKDHEAERQNIGQELLDEIGEKLSLARACMEVALQSPSQDERIKFLHQGIEVLERVSSQVYVLSSSVRPLMFEHLGLESGLRSLGYGLASKTGLKSEFHLEPLEHRLDWVVEIACFRVAQEAVTNVIRHAKASNVSVDLTRKGDQLHLLVRDDGIGFDVAEARQRDLGPGWVFAGAGQQAVPKHRGGLLRMEDYAFVLGGGLEVKSGPGQGTEVHAWFPLRWHPTATTTQA